MTSKQHKIRRSDSKIIAGSEVRHFQSSFHSLAAAKLPSGAGPKHVCVIAKKTARRAVDRNRAKRRCRDMLRIALQSTNVSAAFVVRIKPPALHASYAELKRDIERLVQEAVSRHSAK